MVALCVHSGAAVLPGSVPVWHGGTLEPRPLLASTRLPAWALALSAVPGAVGGVDDRRLANQELVTSGPAPFVRLVGCSSWLNW